MKKSIGVFCTALLLTILTITSCDKNQRNPEVFDPVITGSTTNEVQKSSSIEFDFENQEVYSNGIDSITIAHESGYSEEDEDYWLHVTSMSEDSYVVFLDFEPDHVTFEMCDEEFTVHGKFSVARDDLAIFDVIDMHTTIWSDFVECLQEQVGSDWLGHLQTYTQAPQNLPDDILIAVSGCFALAVAAALL